MRIAVRPMLGLEKIYLVEATTFLLRVALAAMGLETDFRKLCAKGWKPLLLGAGSWLFISGFSLALVELAYNWWTKSMLPTIVLQEMITSGTARPTPTRAVLILLAGLSQ
jgi:hypothetical protein